MAKHSQGEGEGTFSRDLIESSVPQERISRVLHRSTASRAWRCWRKLKFVCGSWRAFPLDINVYTYTLLEVSDFPSTGGKANPIFGASNHPSSAFKNFVLISGLYKPRRTRVPLCFMETIFSYWRCLNVPLSLFFQTIFGFLVFSRWINLLAWKNTSESINKEKRHFASRARVFSCDFLFASSVFV